MNEFYTYGETLIGGSVARADEVAAEFNGIASGMDKLPTEAQLKSGQINYADDAGSPNAYVVTMPQAPISLYNGYTVAFKVANSNTASSTINVNGLGDKSLVNTDGSPLQFGDLVVGAVVTATYDGVKFQVTSATRGVINHTVEAKIAAEDARDAAVIAQGLSEDARDAAVIAQGLSEDARDAAVIAQGLSEDATTYAIEWANNPEDSPVSISAGGDNSTTFSAKHYAAKTAVALSSADMPSITGNGGKFLTTDGISKMWGPMPAGAERISITEISGAPISVEFSLVSGFTYYMLHLTSLTPDEYLCMRTSSDSGVSFDSAADNYACATIYNNPTSYSSISGIGSSDSRTEMKLQASSYSAAVPLGGWISMTGTQSGAFFIIHGDIFAIGASQTVPIRWMSCRKSTSLVDAIQIYSSTGTLASGTITLYGVR